MSVLRAVLIPLLPTKGQGVPGSDLCSPVPAKKQMGLNFTLLRTPGNGIWGFGNDSPGFSGRSDEE
jgi:hypothetical protein